MGTVPGSRDVESRIVPSVSRIVARLTTIHVFVILRSLQSDPERAPGRFLECCTRYISSGSAGDRMDFAWLVLFCSRYDWVFLGVVAGQALYNLRSGSMTGT